MRSGSRRSDVKVGSNHRHKWRGAVIWLRDLRKANSGDGLTGRLWRSNLAGPKSRCGYPPCCIGRAIPELSLNLSRIRRRLVICGPTALVHGRQELQAPKGRTERMPPPWVWVG
jgi:hypothetical protein